MCYSQSLIALNELGCDFNAPIDEEGNTPLMFFLKMGDNCSVYYILKMLKTWTFPKRINMVRVPLPLT